MRDLKTQLLARITILENGCWEWKLKPTDSGYGLMRVGHKHKRLAHKVSYEIFKGQIPEGIKVLHSCDKPNCVNPEHLKLGTQHDNIQDAVKKGRMATKRRNGRYLHGKYT